MLKSILGVCLPAVVGVSGTRKVSPALPGTTMATLESSCGDDEDRIGDGGAGGLVPGPQNCSVSGGDSMGVGDQAEGGDTLEVAGGREPATGLLDSSSTRFLTLQTFSSGKIKKIKSRDFVDMFKQGEYYAPEGATIFSEKNSPTFFVYGGARANKPGHWGMSNCLFKIKTSEVNSESENHASEIVSFEMFNQTASKTSSFCKLYGASGLTEVSSDLKLLGFTINGKNLDCPSESRFVSNEIQILETVSETTFRSTIIRSGQDSVKIDYLKKTETV